MPDQETQSWPAAQSSLLPLALPAEIRSKVGAFRAKGRMWAVSQTALQGAVLLRGSVAERQAHSFLIWKEFAIFEAGLPLTVLGGRELTVTSSREQHSSQDPAAVSPPLPLLVGASQLRLKGMQQGRKPPLTTHWSQEDPLPAISSSQEKPSSWGLGTLHPLRCLPVSTSQTTLPYS